ncbi:MAG: hypothetical protein QOG53_94 [Frankiales bacterium]|jgi:hypothetical protein|nr:hypothetical protein [Frankiales bacterium]
MFERLRVVPLHAGFLADMNSVKVAVAKLRPVGTTRIELLTQIDNDALAPDLQLEMVELWEQCDFWLQAQKQRPLASLAANPTHGDERWCIWEVAAALRLSECTASDRIDTAERLVRPLVKTLTALEEGRITYWQARDIAAGTALLSDEKALVVEEQVLRRAPEQTRVDTRKAVEKAVMAIDPDAADRRRKERRRERRVERPGPVGDGQSGTWIEGPTETLAGFYNVLTVWAREMKKRGVVDTIGAGRFDALMALVFAAACGDLNDLPDAPGPVPAHVGLLVNASTAAGQDDQPAELVGYGPVTAQVARRLIAGEPEVEPADLSDEPWRSYDSEDPDGQWASGPADVTFTVLPLDRTTGWLVKPTDQKLEFGRERRTASRPQRGYITDRDRVCFFPICNRLAEHNDVDHRDDWARDGTTDVDTMGSGCPSHNRVTKNNGWTTIPGPDGTATLISPLGRRYPITPYRYWDP